jgi:hypothetical protein
MRRRATICAAAALTLAGCGSYRRVAPLAPGEQAEITALRGQLTGRRVVVPNAYGSGDPNRNIVAALGVLDVHIAAPADVAGNDCAEVDGESMGAHCMNPMLLTGLTLGIVPYVTPQPTTDWRCRFVADDGRETVKSFRLDDKVVFGWLALPLGVLPAWSPFFFSGEHEDQQTAIRDRFALFLGRNLVDQRK